MLAVVTRVEPSGAVTVSRWWHGLIAAVIVASLVIQLALIVSGGADANSGDVGESPGHDGRVWRVVRLDSLLGIVITGLVFAIVLAPKVHLTGAALAATIGFHYVSPWATLAAWLLLTDIGLSAAVRNALLVVVLGVGLAAGFKPLDGKLPVVSRPGRVSG